MTQREEDDRPTSQKAQREERARAKNDERLAKLAAKERELTIKRGVYTDEEAKLAMACVTGLRRYAETWLGADPTTAAKLRQVADGLEERAHEIGLHS